jgi:hypothetical protein
MIQSEDVIREKMCFSFEQAAAAFGIGLPLHQMMEAMSYITFGTALAWVLGMDEDEVCDAVLEAAKFTLRENPKQLEAFLSGWKQVQG